MRFAPLIGQDKDVAVEEEQLHCESLRHSELFQGFADRREAGDRHQDDGGAGGEEGADQDRQAGEPAPQMSSEPICRMTR